MRFSFPNEEGVLQNRLRLLRQFASSGLLYITELRSQISNQADTCFSFVFRMIDLYVFIFFLLIVKYLRTPLAVTFAPAPAPKSRKPSIRIFAIKAAFPKAS